MEWGKPILSILVLMFMKRWGTIFKSISTAAHDGLSKNSFQSLFGDLFESRRNQKVIRAERPWGWKTFASDYCRVPKSSSILPNRPLYEVAFWSHFEDLQFSYASQKFLEYSRQINIRSELLLLMTSNNLLSDPCRASKGSYNMLADLIVSDISHFGDL